MALAGGKAVKNKKTKKQLLRRATPLGQSAAYNYTHNWGEWSDDDRLLVVELVGPVIEQSKFTQIVPDWGCWMNINIHSKSP